MSRKYSILVLGLMGNLVSLGRAEEAHPVETALQSTTLSGYVDTSASWWPTFTFRPPVAPPSTLLPVVTNYPALGSIQGSSPDVVWPTNSASVTDSGPVFAQLLQVYAWQAGAYYGGAVSVGISRPLIGPPVVYNNSLIYSQLIEPPLVWNDHFENATPLNGAKNDLLVSNLNAALEPGEPVYPNDPGGASVWYAWTAPASGRSVVSLKEWTKQYQAPSVSVTAQALSDEPIFYEGGGITHSSESTTTLPPGIPPFVIDPFRPILAVYTGERVDALTLVGRGTEIVFEAVGGRTYRIAVEGANGSFGETQLHTTQVAPPVNDSFAQALEISEAAEAALSGNTVSASRESGEPNLGPGFEGGSVWFKWRAAAHGYLRFAPGFSLGVFRGDDVSNLELIGKSTTGGVSFFAEEGVVYSIAVYGEVGDEFKIGASGPIYRVYDTTVAELFPDGLDPYFYGLRGATIILHAKSANGWRVTQIEPIRERAAWLTEAPVDALNGKVRVTTIDDGMPAPKVELRGGGNGLEAVLRGLPGQSCYVSRSTDLMNWSAPGFVRIAQRETVLDSVGGGNSVFYRVVQEIPATQIGVTIETAPPPIPPVEPVVENR